MELKEQIKVFQIKLDNILKRLVKSGDIEIFKGLFFGGIDIEKFYVENLLSGPYCANEEINCKIIYSLEDLLIQYFFTFMLEDWAHKDILNSEIDKLDDYWLMLRGNYEQNIVIKTRIVYERIMNFTYWLVKHECLDDKKSNKRSKKKVFTSFINEDEKLGFLVTAMEKVTKLDEIFRTSELHKFSYLRKNLVNNEYSEAIKCCRNLLLDFPNNVYPNLCSLAKGDESRSYSYCNTEFSDDLKIFNKAPKGLIIPELKGKNKDI